MIFNQLCGKIWPSDCSGVEGKFVEPINEKFLLFRGDNFAVLLRIIEKSHDFAPFSSS